jgi:hypothetical protein
VAERYQELLGLLDKAPFVCWQYRRWGVRALVAMGKKPEALAYAEASRGGTTTPPRSQSRARRFYYQWDGPVRPTNVMPSRQTKPLQIWRPTARFSGSIRTRRPKKSCATLIRSAPGEEGKWFATAKEALLLELALELANRSPTDPRTLMRAARDFKDKKPAFAVGAGLAALRWFALGFGYEVTGADVWEAYRQTIEAAERLGGTVEIQARIREAIPATGFVRDVLARGLGLDEHRRAPKKS